MKRFEDKIVMVTGSRRGIGRAILEAFAAEGARLIACSSRYDGTTVQEYQQLADKYGVTISPVFFDLADETDVQRGIQEIKALVPKLDVLVNNAGISSIGLFTLTDMDVYHKVFQINFFSQLSVIRGLLTLIRKPKGAAIVNIVSIAGIDGGVGVTAYGGSKAALALATKTLAQEFALYKIRVNGVAPAMVDTEMAVQMGEKAIEKTISNTVLKRMASPGEVASAVLFLASSEASYINGQILRIDGGM